MKKVILILVLLLSVISHSQDDDTIKYYYPDGTKIIPSKEYSSINDIFNEFFNNYKLYNGDYSFNYKEGYRDFDIIYQIFSGKILFLTGDVEKYSKKQLKKYIDSFELKYKYLQFVIDDYDKYELERDLNQCIEKNIEYTFFLQTLGKPSNSYTSSDGYMSYSYTTNHRSIDLIFENDIFTKYNIIDF